MHLTPYLLPLIFSGAVLAALGVYCLRFRDIPAASVSAIAFFISAGWAFSYAMILASPLLAEKVFWADVRAALLAFQTLAWLAMVVHLTGQAARFSRAFWAGMLAVPLITLLLVGASGFHNWFLYNFRIASEGGLSILLFDRGPWFWVYLVYSYISSLLSIGLLVRYLARAGDPYYRPALLILAGVLVPLVTDVLYELGLTPVQGLNLAPSLLFLSGLAVAVAQFRYRLLDVAPVARSVVFKLMYELALIFDKRGRLVDFNPPAGAVLGLTRSRSLSQSAGQLLKDYPDLLDGFNHEATNFEVGIGQEEQRRAFEVSVVPLSNEPAGASGKMVLMHEITKRKQAERMLLVERDLGQALSAARTLAEAANSVIQAACHVQGIHCAGLYSYSPQAGRLQLIQSQALPGELSEQVEKLCEGWFGATPVGATHWVAPTEAIPVEAADWVARTEGEAVFQPYSAYFPTAAAGASGLQALAILPILSEGRALAVLLCASQTQAELAPGARRALETIAIQTGSALRRVQAEEALQALNDDLEQQIALRTAQLEETIRSLEKEIAERRRAQAALQRAEEGLAQRLADQSRKLAALYEVIILAGQSLEVPDILRQSLERIAEAVSGQAAVIYEKDEKAGCLHLLSAWGAGFDTSPAPESLPLGWLPLDRIPWTAQSLESPFPVVIPGLDHYLGAPITLRGSITGALSVFWSQPNQLPVEDIALFSAMADQLGIILENARLRHSIEAAAATRERRRLARDLHDSVTQSLHSLVLSADTASNRLKLGKLDRLESSLAQLSESARQALKEMRLLLYELRLVPLEEIPLVEALQTRLEAVERRAGVQADLAIEAPNGLPKAWEGDLYAIAVEALNNALKHARASRVSIRLVRSEGGCTLEIADNGLGFDPARPKPGGMGLHSMAERAERLGGRLQISAQPGQGTCVRVTILK